MLYIDTSVLVAAMTREKRTSFIQEWLAKKPEGQLSISDWVITEFSAALSIKLRTRQIDTTHRANALSVFASLVDESFSRIEIGPQEFIAAARYADQFKTGLRAGDALHLAACASVGSRLVTLDKTLSKAATALGIATDRL
ncbi:MAG: type II toxin-antitoxin system VapC family toxin [Pseudomonadota bacterium]